MTVSRADVERLVVQAIAQGHPRRIHPTDDLVALLRPSDSRRRNNSTARGGDHREGRFA